MSDLVSRLEEAGRTGLDMSPGDSLCVEAAKRIVDLERELRRKNQEIAEIQEQLRIAHGKGW